MEPLPIVLPVYLSPISSGARYFKRKRRRADCNSEPSELLKSIRAALQGSGKEPNPPFRTVLSAAADDLGNGEDELAWDEDTVVWSMGGLLKKKWCFAEEGQHVQYACFGWLLQPEVVVSKHAGGAVRDWHGRPGSISGCYPRIILKSAIRGSHPSDDGCIHGARTPASSPVSTTLQPMHRLAA